MAVHKHDFNFSGGNLLYKISAWWFVSYSYYLNIDDKHNAWKKVSKPEKRISRFESTADYHKLWLEEVLKMKKLSENNSAKITAEETKRMAKALLEKIS